MNQWLPAVTSQGIRIQPDLPADLPTAGQDPAITAQEKKYSLLNVEERRTRIQYRPDALFIYNQGGRKLTGNESERMKQALEISTQLSTARGKRFQGSLSGSAQKNLVRAFDNLLLSTRSKIQYNKYLKKNVPFQLAMITLTLPTARRLSSKEMNKRLLKRFLQYIEDYSQRQYKKRLHYMWKLELQMERKDRKQLHWHIILDRFIPYEVVAKFWSYLLNDAGLAREYYTKTGRRYVKPATRTESVKKNTAGDLRGYMLKKYLKKKTDNGVQVDPETISDIDGTAWGCSDALKEPYPGIEVDFSMYMRMKEYLKQNADHAVYFDYCMIIRDSEKKPPDKLLSPKFRAIIRCHQDLITFGGSSQLKNLN